MANDKCLMLNEKCGHAASRTSRAARFSSFLEAGSCGTAGLAAHRLVVGADLGKGAIAPTVRGVPEIVIRAGILAGQGRNEHFLGAQKFAGRRLGHNHALS